MLPDPLAYIESGERYHDYSLEWDTVNPLGYKKWQFPLRKSELIKQSKMRVSKNEKFKKIKDSVKYLKDKKDDTEVKLSLSFFRNRRDSAEKDSKNLEYDEINKDIVVDNVSLDMKLLSEDQKERKTEWVDTLKKDPFLEETLFILNDLSKFTMALKNK